MKSSEECCNFVMATDDNERKQKNKAMLAERPWGLGVYFQYFLRHGQTSLGNSVSDFALQFCGFKFQKVGELKV